MSIQALVDISRYYGANPDYVLAGGGNTSFKDGNTLYIKGSGTSLAEAVPEGFVKMDRGALSRIWEKIYPETSAERESAVLADMMAARMSGEEQKRPSVETLLHDILPFAFVVHTHPALVNGLACSQQGEAAMREIFGDSGLASQVRAIWIPSTNPGYILSRLVKDAMDAYRVKHGKNAAVIFLQNHGIFVGADSIEEIKRIYTEIMAKIGAKIKKQPDFSREIRDIAGAADNPLADEFARALAELARTSEANPGNTAFLRNNEIAAFVKDRASFAPVSSAFTPDHIVYAGSHPLFSEAKNTAELREDWNAHAAKTGRKAKLVAVQGMGVFGVGTTEKAALLAVELFKDSVKVAVYAESFGGPRFMTDDQIDFINNWEVERFRSSVSAK